MQCSYFFISFFSFSWYGILDFYAEPESFELMRKEQQKALQEKQKQLPDNHKQNLDVGIVALLDCSADKNIIGKADEEEVPSKSQIESCRVSTHAPLSRPLVPPGFASTPVDKILPAQSVSFGSEVLIIQTSFRYFGMICLLLSLYPSCEVYRERR